jgi:hypothetical protein
MQMKMMKERILREEELCLVELLTDSFLIFLVSLGIFYLCLMIDCILI